MNEIDPKVKWFFETLCKGEPQVLFVRMNGGKPVHELRSWDDGLSTLTMWNEAGWDCFFTVGVTDGSGYRRTENMKHPRAVFVDLDKPETSQAALDFLLGSANAPSAVVNTSPGKYHVYWFHEQGLPWNTWTYYQKFLAAQLNTRFGAGTADSSVCDPSRTMRTPGSLHWKKDKYRGSVVETSERIYTLAELESAFPKAPPPPPAVKRAPMEPNHPFAKAGIEQFKKLLSTLTIEKETDWGYIVTCPNAHEHTTPGDSANLYAPSAGNAWQGGFSCMHDHCKLKYGSPAIQVLRMHQALAYAEARRKDNANVFNQARALLIAGGAA